MSNLNTPEAAPSTPTWLYKLGNHINEDLRQMRPLLLRPSEGAIQANRGGRICVCREAGVLICLAFSWTLLFVE